MIPLFVFVVLVSSAVHGKVYTPCGLAQDLYKHLSTKYGIYDFLNYNQDAIGLLVCVGAYHDFNTSSIVVTDDGNRHEGIFGLIPTAENGTRSYNFTDDCVKDDAEYFIEQVLYIAQEKSLVKNTMVRDFYEDLCDKFITSHEIYCRLSDYIFGNFPVSIPNEKTLMYGKCYQPLGDNGKPRRCSALAGDLIIGSDDDLFPFAARRFGHNSSESRSSTVFY